MLTPRERAREELLAVKPPRWIIWLGACSAVCILLSVAAIAGSLIHFVAKYW